MAKGMTKNAASLAKRIAGDFAKKDGKDDKALVKKVVKKDLGKKKG